MAALIIIFVTAIIGLFTAFTKQTKLVSSIIISGLVAALGMMVYEWFNPLVLPSYYQGLIFNHWALAFGITATFVTLLICIAASDKFSSAVANIGDYYGLILFSLCGALCLFGFTDMFMLFIGIEILSIPLYVLAGMNKSDTRSNEAAIKYFLMGAFATGILLLGIALVYGASGSFVLEDIRAAYISKGGMSPMFYVGVIFMLIGLCFKVGAVPFHFWSPDVYEGSPSIITSYMATVVKTAAFAAFMKLFFTAFSLSYTEWVPTLAIIAGLTMTIANITAVFQSSFKRMLAYSSISHVGYILLALVVMNQYSTFNLLFYTLAYSLATVATFLIFMVVSERAGMEGFDAFRGMAKKNPWLAAALTVCVLSMAGIPLTAGFFGKYYLFSNAFVDHPYLIIIAVLNSAISIYYYFRVIINMYFVEEQHPSAECHCVPNAYSIVIGVCVTGILSLGLVSGYLFKVFY